jgi:hypothetical protein
VSVTGLTGAVCKMRIRRSDPRFFEALLDCGKAKAAGNAGFALSDTASPLLGRGKDQSNSRDDRGLHPHMGGCSYRCQYPYVLFIVKSWTLHEPCLALGIDYTALYHRRKDGY